jgi:hypothetical protein
MAAVKKSCFMVLNNPIIIKIIGQEKITCLRGESMNPKFNPRKISPITINNIPIPKPLL